MKILFWALILSFSLSSFARELECTSVDGKYKGTLKIYRNSTRMTFDFELRIARFKGGYNEINIDDYGNFSGIGVDSKGKQGGISGRINDDGTVTFYAYKFSPDDRIEALCKNEQ